MDGPDPNSGPCPSADAVGRFSQTRMERPPLRLEEDLNEISKTSYALREGIMHIRAIILKSNNHFARFLEPQADLAIYIGRENVQDVCDGPAGADACIIILNITSIIAGYLAFDMMSSTCRLISNEMYTRCEGTSGTADFTIGAETGVVLIDVESKDCGKVNSRPGKLKTICEATSLWDYHHGNLLLAFLRF